ncbi:hypothetical protein BLNAU_14851 [Blattamonas nauphoetae]|uniref:Uncharacterized protein n=1 Tax=Blattamonas nauphoetae TaxID=2049346 RepID=A0ABQ9XFI2_9EUKA|nr:hypothetical protein BLNAU_14851 [Blattamonas nauphoetae]
MQSIEPTLHLNSLRSSSQVPTTLRNASRNCLRDFDRTKQPQVTKHKQPPFILAFLVTPSRHAGNSHSRPFHHSLPTIHATLPNCDPPHIVLPFLFKHNTAITFATKISPATQLTLTQYSMRIVTSIPHCSLLPLKPSIKAGFSNPSQSCLMKSLIHTSTEINPNHFTFSKLVITSSSTLSSFANTKSVTVTPSSSFQILQLHGQNTFFLSNTHATPVQSTTIPQPSLISFREFCRSLQMAFSPSAEATNISGNERHIEPQLTLNHGTISMSHISLDFGWHDTSVGRISSSSLTIDNCPIISNAESSPFVIHNECGDFGSALFFVD